MKYILPILFSITLFCIVQSTSVAQVFVTKDSIMSLIGRNQKFYSYSAGPADSTFQINPTGSAMSWDFSKFAYDSLPSTIYYDSTVSKSACKDDPHFVFSNFLMKILTPNDSSFDYYYLNQRNLVLLGTCPRPFEATRYKSGLIKLGDMPLQMGKTWDSDNKVDYTADSTFKYNVIDTGKVDAQGEIILRDTVAGKTRTVKVIRIKNATYASFGGGKAVPSIKYSWYSNPSEGNLLVANATVDSAGKLVSAQYFDPLSKAKKDTTDPIGVVFNNSRIKALSQNNPNPFTNQTTINFALKDYSKVRIEVVDVNGNIIAVPKDEAMISGEHQVAISMQGLPTSTYLCRFYVDGKVAGTLKMLKQ